MAEPDTTRWAVGVLTLLTGWLGKVMHNRVTRLEIKTQTSEQAALQRSEILKNIEGLQTRMDLQHNILVSRIDSLYRETRR